MSDETENKMVLDDEDETDEGTKPEAKPETKKPAAKAPAAKAPAKAKTVTPKRVKIVLEENDDIPPTGLYVGLNGRGYLISPGEEVSVPEGVVDILEHAITSVPQIDSKSRQVVGYRNRMKYPFRRV